MVSRDALRQGMLGNAKKESDCFKVSGDQVSFSKKCMKSAVPKGTNAGTWTEADRAQARSIYV